MKGCFPSQWAVAVWWRMGCSRQFTKNKYKTPLGDMVPTPHLHQDDRLSSSQQRKQTPKSKSQYKIL
jgi:hypothetical protein